jgi:hypothetical protein
MELTRTPPRNIMGAALIATLWHPYLGAAMARALGLMLPASAQSTLVIVAGLVCAWCVLFLGEILTETVRRPRWLHVDVVLADPSLGAIDKLRGVASSWVGRALLLGFAGYLVMLGAGLARILAS